MNDPKIVASAREQSRRAPGQSRESRRSWAVLGWIGLAFLVVGGMDFALAWFPLGFGNPEWEFGTVTQTFNGLPILLLGIGLLVVASEQVERPWWSVLGMAAALALLVWMLAGAALWASNVQLALSTVPEDLRSGVQKAVAKTVVQSVVYPAALAYMAVRIWRARGTGGALS